MHSNVSKGQCTSCGDYNAHTATICSGCGTRLPWANGAIGTTRVNPLNGQPDKPLTPASRRPSASANSLGWFGSAGAIALLVLGILIGAALMVPNFVSFSKPAPQNASQPTPAPKVTTTTPGVSPSSPVTTAKPLPSLPQPANSTQPGVAPSVSQRPMPQGQSSDSQSSDYQLPMSKTDSVPQIIADISADIEAANTPMRADQIAFACHRIEAHLRDKARHDPKDVDISSNWSMAMGHLAAAAEAKSALLSNPPSYDVQRLSMNLKAGLINAKNSGQAAQQFIDEKNDPELARRNRERFRERTDEYERYNRDVARGNSR